MMSSPKTRRTRSVEARTAVPRPRRWVSALPVWTGADPAIGPCADAGHGGMCRSLFLRTEPRSFGHCVFELFRGGGRD